MPPERRRRSPFVYDSVPTLSARGGMVMATREFFARYRLLGQAAAAMRDADSVEAVLEVLRVHARAIGDADGVAVVLRRGDEVAYVGEDAIAPLWTGQAFPIERCVSGLAILANAPIVIPDITNDARVPLQLYLATFVKSMAMFPLGAPVPIAALGLYWREPRALGRDVEALMSMLAQGANAAFQTMAIRDERAAGRLAA
jgi:hypothetical protein